MRSENGKLESTDVRVPTSHHYTNEKATHTTVYKLILHGNHAARTGNRNQVIYIRASQHNDFLTEQIINQFRSEAEAAKRKIIPSE